MEGSIPVPRADAVEIQLFDHIGALVRPVRRDMGENRRAAAALRLRGRDRAHGADEPRRLLYPRVYGGQYGRAGGQLCLREDLWKAEMKCVRMILHVWR